MHLQLYELLDRGDRLEQKPRDLKIHMGHEKSRERSWNQKVGLSRLVHQREVS